MSNLKLSIIIVSYNTKDMLSNCLDSLYRLNRNFTFEVIIIDNDSADGSPALVRQLQKKYPRLTLLPLSKNLGFGSANNYGARHARGKYLLFLNSDTLVPSGVLKQALTMASSTNKLGVFSCKLKNSDGTTQANGGFFPTLKRLLLWQTFIDDLPGVKGKVKSIHPPADFYRRTRSLDWVTGAFMLIPRTVFEAVGGFDPDIFMYVEDTELCYRIKRMGHKVIYSNTPSIIHLGGGSSSSGWGLLKEAEMMIYFFRRHRGFLPSIIAKQIIKLGALLRVVLFTFIPQHASKTKVYRQILAL